MEYSRDDDQAPLFQLQGEFKSSARSLHLVNGPVFLSDGKELPKLKVRNLYNEICQPVKG